MLPWRTGAGLIGIPYWHTEIRTLNIMKMETHMRRTRILAIAAIGFVSSAPLRAQQKEPFPGFDAYVNTALTTWKVPGAAVAIVRNDSIIYAKGYGVREIGKPARVDEHTL